MSLFLSCNIFCTDRAGNPCSCVFRGCVCRCSPRRNPCTCFLCGRARRCQTRRMPCGCFFGGCAGTLRAFSSQMRRSHYYCRLLLQAAAFGLVPCADEGRFRFSTASALPVPLMLPCLCMATFFFLLSSFSLPAPRPHRAAPAPPGDSGMSHPPSRSFTWPPLAVFHMLVMSSS